MRDFARASNRVLVADDDSVIRRLLVAAVVNEGFTPVEAADGREAFRILQKDSDFKAAVLDWAMPYLNGIDLVGYMGTEKRLQRIPVMLITADESVSVMTKSFSAGAVAFLPKPFGPEQLQGALRMLLATRNKIAA